MGRGGITYHIVSMVRTTEVFTVRAVKSLGNNTCESRKLIISL